MSLRKAGAIWVDGDRFFDREVELEILAERARDGTHTLLTAPRRMGKTSLVRESLRLLAENEDFETIFVDLEDASDAGDAIAEIAVQTKSAKGVWNRICSDFFDAMKEIGSRVNSLTISELRVQLRAKISSGNQWRRGDEIFSALAESKRPVVLAIDELPILVNRLFSRNGDTITSEGIQVVDEFLSWLRKNGQAHRGRIVMVLSGSVGLEPILRRAGLSAQANIYTPLDLKPWTEDVATDCLAALAETYGVDLPIDVRRDMCHRLRHYVPHHIQQFFDHMHEHLRREDRTKASLNDVRRVYENEMLSIRGQVDLEHYEGRLRMVLEKKEYQIALELLTEAAISDGKLSDDSIDLYCRFIEATDRINDTRSTIENVLHLLEHDGYLERQSGGYRFISGLLEDWWRTRHGQRFVPIRNRQVKVKRRSLP